MNPLLVIFAIRAAIRIGRTAADAFDQYAQERPILIPDAELVGSDATLYVRRVAKNFPEFAELLASDPELSKLWSNDAIVSAPGAEDAMVAIAYRFEARTAGTGSHVAAHTDEEIIGGIVVGQWAEGKGPVRPWARIIIALADVALEYVASNPQVLGVGGDGEKLIGAIAGAIAERIPDDDSRTAFGVEERFAERLAAIALHAGLKTMTEQPELVFGEKHLQALLSSTLAPVIDTLPKDLVSEQVEWRKTVDALLGPAVSAALSTVAEHPRAFLGNDFAADRAAGVMVTGLLQAAADLEVGGRFTRDGLLALFRAAAGVAAENPELVLGDLLDKDLNDPETRRKADTVVVELFRSMAGVLESRKEPFAGDLGTAVAVASIEALQRSSAALFNQSKPWEKVAGAMTSQILDGFQDALGDDARSLADTVFSKDRLVELARVFVSQVAATPHLISVEDEELKRIVSAVASAMARDEKLLLTGDDWIKIAGVAAQEAALNPGRLFGISDKSLQGMLTADIVAGLLRAAGNDLVRSDREVGPVMIGETLREAVVVTIRGIAGNVEKAFEHRASVEALATRLNDAAAERGLSMGGKEWLRLFRATLPSVLDNGTLPELDDARISALLAA